MLRRTRCAAGALICRWAKTARTPPKIGKGETNPVACGPSFGAIAVSKNTRLVAIPTRRGRSHFGGAKVATPSSTAGFGIAHKIIARKKATTMNIPARPSGRRSSNDANTKNAATPARALTIQFLREAVNVYAKQNAPTAINPASVPIAACAAKVFPCSIARKMETGPEVNGRPATAPLTAGPHRLPIKVKPATNNGVRRSLSRRMSIAGFFVRLKVRSSVAHE